jgi:hypothetical protein
MTHQPDRFDSGYLLGGVVQALEELCAIGSLVCGSRNRDTGGEEVTGLDARIGPQGPHEAAQQETTANQEDDRKTHYHQGIAW